MSNREWRCSWSSANSRCSNYIWVINNFIAYQDVTYIRTLTVGRNGLTITTRLLKCHHRKLCTFRHFIWITANIYFGNEDENINWYEIVHTHYMTVADWLLLTCISLNGIIVIWKYYMQFLYLMRWANLKARMIGMFKHMHKFRSCKPATGFRVYLCCNDKSTSIENCHNNSLPL